MTNNDNLRRLRKWIEDCHRDSDQDCDREHPKQVGMRLAWRMVRDEINNLLAEPEAQAPSEAASPVTDAEVEAAIESVRVAAHRYGVDAWAPTLIDESQALKSQEDKAVCDLRALIARRVQQAGAAAEDLARAAEGVRLGFVNQRGDMDAMAAKFPDAAGVNTYMTQANVWNSAEVQLRTALAAFRAAQGGGK